MIYRWILNRFCYFLSEITRKTSSFQKYFLWSLPCQHFVWYPIIMYSVNSPKSSLVICFYYRNDHTNSPFLLCLNALYTNSTRITRGDRPALQSFISTWRVLTLSDSANILYHSHAPQTTRNAVEISRNHQSHGFSRASWLETLWELVLSRFWDLPMEISSRAGFVWLWWQRTPRHQTNASQGYRWFYSRLDSLEILTITHQPTDTLLCCIDQPCTSLKTGKAPGKLLKIFC